MVSYEDWKTGIRTMENYTDDLDYFIYPIYRSDDKKLEIARIKDFQGKITFNVRFNGVEFINIDKVGIDQDDDICIYKNHAGLVGVIAKRFWLYGWVSE